MIDVFFRPHRDALHIIDKRTQEVVKTVRPAPGKSAAHVEFTRDGKFALVSTWEQDAALVVDDARTLEKVRHVPMKTPSRKYSVYNKITSTTGTSH